MLAKKHFMKIFPTSQIKGHLLIIAFFFFSVCVNAQQMEYRITEEGKYEHLNDLKETGMVYDESNGSYYKPISSRTFFLEAQKRGYITEGVSYAQFIELPVILQIAAVNQPLAEVIDCSTNHTSPKCLRFIDLVLIIPETDTVLVVPILKLKEIPLTQLERAKLFLRSEN